MPAELTDFDRLIFGFKKLNFLDFEWLEERLAEAQPKFEAHDAAILSQRFSGLPFKPTWIAQAWALYVQSQKIEEVHQRDIAFLHIILGLQEAWPKQMPFSETVVQTAMKIGARRAAQMLKIILIFHDDCDILSA